MLALENSRRETTTFFWNGAWKQKNFYLNKN